MKRDLQPTGERVIEDAYQHSIGAYTIYAMHAASYAFVENMCKNKVVLDLGCGSGYGTERISNVARTTYGVDISQEAVDYARDKYRKDNLHFQKVDIDEHLPFADNTFDVVLSFQVIEHVQDDEAYVRQANRVLAPNGVFVVITPDRKNRLLPGQRPWNRWHVREYDGDQLFGLINKYIPVSKRLNMGAPWKIAKVEINRYRLLKWVCLPATLPFMPEFVRVGALNAIHRLAAMRSRPPTRERPRNFGFDESDLIISENAENSLNVIIVAQKTCKEIEM